jgi:hypothetical protein
MAFAMPKLFVLHAVSGLLLLLNAQPTAEISNSKVKAKLYLPDAENGYYRATRFDWSGVIASLEANGRNYFGQWFERYDPKIHDAITGPVEEFLSGDTALGYNEAKAGEKFVRIGVGALRKPEERQFQRFKTYEILDHGKWATRTGPGWIEFTHELTDTNGYAYVYRKRLSLTKDKAELVLDHSLKNTGRKAIDTSVYNHDFYMLDGQPTGPDITVKFPFTPHAQADFKNLAEMRGKDLVYLAELKKGETVFTEFDGFGTTPADYDFRVENRKTGTGVRQRGDRPISKLVFWSIRTTVCPEAYVHMNIEPGKEFTWRIQYEFYKL